MPEPQLVIPPWKYELGGWKFLWIFILVFLVPGISESNSDNYQFIAFYLQIQSLYLHPKDRSGSFEYFWCACCRDIKVCLERMLERQYRKKGFISWFWCAYTTGFCNLSSFSSVQFLQNLWLSPVSVCCMAASSTPWPATAYSQAVLFRGPPKTRPLEQLSLVPREHNSSKLQQVDYW